MQLSASLVVYKNDPKILKQVLVSFKKIPIESILYVIDNSPTSELKSLFQSDRVVYIHKKGENLGFGKAHNIAIKRAQSKYHLVLNPDVFFESQVVPELIEYLEENLDIGLIQPKICFPNGDLQYLCKQSPTVFALFLRRFIPQKLYFLVKSYSEWYEMRESGYDQIIDVPYLSGCFMLFRKSHLDEVGYFDENIFMYLEDADITIRMADKYRSVFYPKVSVNHYWGRGSHRSLKLTLVTIKSAIYFFNKYGWKFI